MSDQTPTDGAWIFVSHSNLDLTQVRQIRDALEKEGHKPLLFFLKCLGKKDPRLPQLIKDEIKARTWFILCDSDFAKASPWVQEEVAIVKSTKPRETFVSIDLAKDLAREDDGDVPPFLRKIRPLLKRATVFLSYARSDAAIARKIYDALVEQDYRAFLDVNSLLASDDFLVAIDSAIQRAVEHGFVLLLLSPDYLSSAWCAEEREFALKDLASRPVSNVVPVIVRDPEYVYRHLPHDLAQLQCVDMTKGPIARNVAALLADLKTRMMR